MNTELLKELLETADATEREYNDKEEASTLRGAAAYIKMVFPWKEDEEEEEEG